MKTGTIFGRPLLQVAVDFLRCRPGRAPRVADAGCESRTHAAAGCERDGSRLFAAGTTLRGDLAMFSREDQMRLLLTASLMACAFTFAGPVAAQNVVPVEKAQAEQNLPQLREAVNKIWSLQPPDEVEVAKEQAAQSGLRGA